MPTLPHRFPRLAPLLVLAALALAASWQNRRLAAARRAGLPEAPAYAAEAPPFLNFLTVGLGGFRGLAAEVLWTRADRLQEEGRYFELVQLYEWITWLDPHATETWTYSAMTMAYDISAMMRRPEDRLRWVSHGIALLRDRGLPANPASAKLHRELAWIYQHKIGGADDSAHLLYKSALAAAMAPLLQPDGSVSNTPANRAALAALHLDADAMLRLERRFGPLDWRVASSHAVYWGALGLEHAHGQERLACRRAVYQPLIQGVQAGRLGGSSEEGAYRAAPNPALIRPAVRFMQETMRESPTSGVRMAYTYFLLLAIRQAEQEGDHAQAESWLRELNRAGEGLFRPMTLESVLQGQSPRSR